MPVTFRLPTYLRPWADGQREVQLETAGPTVGDALRSLAEKYPALLDRVLTETGEVRQHVNIFVGDESIRYTGGLATPLPSQAQVHIVPAVSGG